MSALEQEYRDNLQRVKNRERARERWLWLGLAAAGLPVCAGSELSNGFSVHVVVDLAWRVAPFALLPAIAIADRLRKGWEDRGVVEITTDRERLYRDAPLPDAPASSDSRRWLVAAPLALPLAVYAIRRCGWIGDGLCENLVVVAVVLGSAGAGAVIKRIYETWRSRRNARLRLKWDRWLASADSCKVGAREWTE